MTRCPNCFVALTPGTDTSVVETCPNCRYRLLPGWRAYGSTCLVMAGARATGKSIYIGVMIKQLMQFGEVSGRTVTPATDAVAQVFRDVYEGPLYEQRGILIETRPAANEDSYQREPLIFVLRDGSGGRHHLVIRDVAGEDLERSELDVANLAFFNGADGVLFLFDPLRVPEIARSLNEVVPAQRVGGDPTAVLQNTLTLTRRSRPKLAVILSKFDAMQSLRGVDRPEWRRIMDNAGAAIFRDPGSVGPYDDVDGELLHEEVRSLLYRLSSAAVITTVEAAVHEQGLTYRYFAVSALGDAPDGPALHPRGIAPFRCLDPLKWVLDGTGVL